MFETVVLRPALAGKACVPVAGNMHQACASSDQGAAPQISEGGGCRLAAERVARSQSLVFG